MRLVLVLLALAAAALAACTCAPGEACDLSGACVPRCVAALCEVWNTTLGACVSACSGCTACADGVCAARPELRNACGACPGDANYTLCASVAGPVALGCPLFVNGVDVIGALNRIVCDNRDAYARLPCSTNADCTTCDYCLSNACVNGLCVSTPQPLLGCGSCVVAADCGLEPCVDVRCNVGNCVRRVLPYCTP